MKDQSEYYTKELERLELQQKDLHDRYSSKEIKVDRHDYSRIVNANIKIAPKSGEKLKNYIEKVKVHQEISQEVNWKTHVDNPYKVWHTHKLPMGCFMCKDTEFISVLVQVLELIDKSNPNISF